ncbi:GH39 family glycosyl hydrolase [Thermocatellispora tengchongensis]|uniref:GH39 family glycosyl hydrolase n=1 Tax=Thermocatellispora tengchongensis TaxID=1073253 RepID=UPI00336F87BC
MALALIVGILFYASRDRETGRGQAMTVAPTEPAPSLQPPPVTADWPRWGVTHTQYSADNETPDVTEAASHLLDRVPMLQNQHIMGWGAGNPEPAPGQYDFRDLDRRVKFMAQSKSIPVLTLCCAPDWMKNGSEGRTDWTRIEVAPQRDHFDDYAKLAATVAKRYPTVKHFMVWNEFKGFWHNSRNEWDAAAYTELYNKVYTALKAVNKDIKVGGPYIPIDSNVTAGPRSELTGPWGTVDQRTLDAIQYWLKNKKGADFIIIDGSSANKDKGLVPDEFTALGKFSAVTNWVRRESNDLPVWWAEWYVETDGSDWDENRRVAVQAAAMMEFASSGVTTALYWNPQRKAGGTDQTCPGCLWQPGTGRELPMAGIISGFTKWFPAHVTLEDVTASDPRVKVLAQPRQLVMVNTTNTKLTVTVDNQEFQLNPYEVKWSDRGA